MRFKSNIGFFLFGLLFFPLILHGQIRFTDVTQIFGVKGYSYFGGHGVCWVDVDGDGDLDIYVKNVGSPKGILELDNNLFINYGNYFTEEATERGVSDGYAIGTHGAVFADLDKDKDFDLFSTTTYDGISPAYNHLYQNDGIGYFEDITSVITPSQAEDTASRGVAAADFDGDGDLDLYFSNPLPEPDTHPIPLPPNETINFYMNNGDGTFSNEYRGINWTRFVQGVAALDVDGDGDIDIAEAKPGGPSTIYLNDGTAHFHDAGTDLGLPSTLGLGDNGMTFADVDNDGDMDLAIAGGRRIALYRNAGGFFTQYQTIDSARTHQGFHASFGDFDHDGDLDLYFSGENVYENDGQGIFSLILTSNSGLKASLNTNDPRGSALGDFDNDGDLDIYVTDKRDYNVLFRNNNNDSNWIKVEVIDRTGAAGGIGTKLDLYQAGHVGQRQYLKGHREIHGEYGYLGQDSPLVHFGTPSSGSYDLKVTFFDGTVKILNNISPGQEIQVAYILPPLNFSGMREENKALFYRENVIVLSWQANPHNENIQRYRIYQSEGGSWMLLDEVYADTFSYMVRAVEKDRQYQFAVAAVDQNNTEGALAYTTVQ